MNIVIEKDREAAPARVPQRHVEKATCRMCHGGCGTLVHVEDGVVVKVEGDPDSPVNEGRLCTKAGKASIEQLYHQDRINHPLIRSGPKGSGEFRRATWDEAIAYVAERMLAIRAAHGAEAVAFGRGVSMNNNQIVTRLANVFGTPNILSINYYCYGPRAHACTVTASGTHVSRSWDTVAVADFFGEPSCIVEWGSQKRISNDHGFIGHTPVTQALKRNPVSIIVDPRRPLSAGKGDVWLPLRPGTDAAMALGWIHVILREDLHDHDFVAKWCHGFEELRRRAADYTPERVAEITGCDAEEIVKAARLYATTKPAAIAWGNGIDQLGVNTTQATRAVFLLVGLTGNLDVKGGNCFWPMPKLSDIEMHDRLTPEQQAKRLGAAQFPALNLRPTVYAHPPTAFRAMLSGDPYPVRALLVVGNNPAVCYPNTETVTEALMGLDLLVVNEIFMTPTASMADVVFPAASNLEREEPRLYMHIKRPDGMLLDASTRKLATVGERLSDWEMLVRLGQALGYRDEFPSVDALCNQALAASGLSWDELLQSSEAVVEPMRYRKYEQEGFGTPTGKFELYSTIYESWGVDPLPFFEEPRESHLSRPDLADRFPLILNTGVRTPMYWGSNGHPLASLRRQMPEPLMEVHGETAQALGLANNAMALIETPQGHMRMRVRWSDRTRRDVVSVPHGWWEPTAAAPYRGIRELCTNMLTDDDPANCDRVIGASPLKALMCRISPA